MGSVPWICLHNVIYWPLFNTWFSFNWGFLDQFKKWRVMGGTRVPAIQCLNTIQFGTRAIFGLKKTKSNTLTNIEYKKKRYVYYHKFNNIMWLRPRSGDTGRVWNRYKTLVFRSCFSTKTWNSNTKPTEQYSILLEVIGFLQSLNNQAVDKILSI